MKRFYAYPPEQTKWKYILRNIKQKSQPQAIHEIVDIKVYDLTKEDSIYPEHSKEKLKLWKDLNINGWKVVPDCPDFKGEKHKDCQSWKIDNVEYSQELLLKYYTDPINQLPVIQSKTLDLESLENSCKWFKREFDIPKQIALTGSICRINNKKFVTDAVNIFKSQFPNSWLHLFAPRLNHINNFYTLIDSFDSSCWTYSRGQGKPSCRLHNRAEFFYEYLKILNKHIQREDLNVRI